MDTKKNKDPYAMAPFWMYWVIVLILLNFAKGNWSALEWLCELLRN